MRKEILLLFFVLASTEAFAQVVTSDRQIGWGFVAIIAKVVCVLMAIGTIISGLFVYWGTASKKSKKKHKRKHKRAEQPVGEVQAETDEDSDNDDNSENEAKTQQTEQGGRRRRKKHHSSTHGRTNYYAKHRAYFRRLAYICFIIAILGFLMSVWAEKEMARHDRPDGLLREESW